MGIHNQDISNTLNPYKDSVSLGFSVRNNQIIRHTPSNKKSGYRIGYFKKDLKTVTVSKIQRCIWCKNLIQKDKECYSRVVREQKDRNFLKYHNTRYFSIYFCGDECLQYYLHLLKSNKVWIEVEGGR